MFRKDDEMTKQWDDSTPARYAAMQRELLEQGAEMLASGGTLVYSTCTFSPEENEQIIALFLDRHPDFEVVPQEERFEFRSGRPDWIEAFPGMTSERPVSAQTVSGTVRLWPHHVKGEGHYAAVLRRTSSEQSCATATPEDDPVHSWRSRETVRADERRQRGAAGKRPARADTSKAAVDVTPFHEFWSSFVDEELPGRVTLFGEHLYVTPAGLCDLSGIRVIRPGLYAGAVHKGRFEPAHALAMALNPAACARTLSLDSESAEAIRYLKGETLEIPGEQVVCASGVQPKGRCLVCIDGFPVGWGKWMDGMLKNEYPAGWRWT